MVRACKLAGAVLRPNSSLAGVAGSSGLASGGSGCGLRVPLSCALATCGASTAANSSAAERHAVLHRAAPFGASIVVMLAASDLRVPPPPRRLRRFDPTPSPAVRCRVNRGTRPVKRNAVEKPATAPIGEAGKVTNYHQALIRAATACARRR